MKEHSDKSLARLDAQITSKFVCSNMSNAKWLKLLQAVSDFKEESYPISYKLVHCETIFRTDTEPYSIHVDSNFFVEPTLYKEVQWIEFDNAQIPNLSQLIAHISQLGKFPLERIPNGYRLNAYA